MSKRLLLPAVFLQSGTKIDLLHFYSKTCGTENSLLIKHNRKEVLVYFMIFFISAKQHNSEVKKWSLPERKAP